MDQQKNVLDSENRNDSSQHLHEHTKISMLKFVKISAKCEKIKSLLKSKKGKRIAV